jgi:hypothetical protein
MDFPDLVQHTTTVKKPSPLPGSSASEQAKSCELPDTRLYASSNLGRAESYAGFGEFGIATSRGGAPMSNQDRRDGVGPQSADRGARDRRKGGL